VYAHSFHEVKESIMSCKMKIDTFTADVASDTSEVHLMPCRIDYNAEAKIRQYFSPTISPKIADRSDGKKQLKYQSHLGFLRLESWS